MSRQLETVVTSIFFTLFIFAAIIGWSLFIYLLTTSFWWIDLLYLAWLIFDINTPEVGGRQIPFIMNAKIWYNCKNYFSSTVTLASGFSLQPSRNYLFCFFPHGIIPIGPYVGLTSGVSDFHQWYPNFTVHVATLRFLLLTPFMREIGLAMGLISCSEKALNYVLSRPKGGNIVNLSPGGAVEAYYCRPGQYKFIVKKRRGFVRVALKNGSPLVPVITFGENDIFQQIENHRMMGLQEFVRKKIGFATVLFYGRGLYENWYGWFPRRRALNTVVGKPIDVVKTANPTSQQIEEIHGIFVKELIRLFDTYKCKFLKNSENVFLELE